MDARHFLTDILMIAILGVTRGYDLPGFPFVQEQCAGGYLAMGLILLWGLRRTFGSALSIPWRSAFAKITAK